MGEQTPELRDIEVHRIGTLRRTANGHPYLEADTSEGVAAVWGFGEETSNIVAMQQAQLPVAVRCQVRIPKHAGRHALWIPWSSPLFLSSALSGDRPADEGFDADAARDELSRLGRVLSGSLDRIEAQASNEGLVPRILRLSKARLIPRRMSALMIFVAELRNSAEHDREPFTDLQARAGRTAWQAITVWLESLDQIQPWISRRSHQGRAAPVRNAVPLATPPPQKPPVAARRPARLTDSSGTPGGR